jgi:hypothetical protein
MSRLDPGRRSCSALDGALLAASGCAQLHAVQLGDIDSSRGTLRPFEVKVSETGVSQEEAAGIASGIAAAAGSRETAGGIGAASGVISLFNFGPRTGNPVFSDTYADGLWELVSAHCPSGRVTGLIAVREQRKYPVISGEIVKIQGYCIDAPGRSP